MPMTSCVLDSGADIPVPGDEISVRFSIRAGGAAGDETRSILKDDESEISTIDVLAFVEDANNDFRYAYKASTLSTNENDGANGREVTVTVTAKGYSARQQFVVLVNASQELAAAGIILNEKLSDAVKKITCASGGGEWPAKNNGAAAFKRFPMYAKTTAQVVDSNTGSIGDYPLIRMVAKVNVKLAAGVTNFRLVNASLFNYKTAGYVAYDFSGFNGTVASLPAIPAAGDHTGDPILEPTVFYAADYGNDPKGVISNSIYTFETDGIPDENSKLTKTALVIGGYYGSNTTDIVYYRIDFKTTDDLSAAVSGGLLRNHEYNVTVQSVAASGYESALKAYLGDKPVEFTVEVTPWNENWEIPIEWEVPLQETSNCYIVEKKKTIAIPIMGQIERAVAEGHLPSTWISESMNLKGELIWGEGENRNDAVKYYTVNAYKSNENKYGIPILTVAANYPGNAVVGVYDDVNDNGICDADEGFLWSWHIWVLEENDSPQAISGFMDRYLGAMSPTWVNPGQLGDPVIGVTYQFGRKDPTPFQRPGYSENGHLGTITGNSIEESIRQPGKTISNWTAPVLDLAFWNSASGKTVFDPCPLGWKVPSVAEVQSGTWVSNGLGSGAFRDGCFWAFGSRTFGSYPAFYVRVKDNVGVFELRNIGYDYDRMQWTWQGANTASHTGELRCVRDELYVPYAPTLTTDSDGAIFEADGSTYNVKVMSNTTWTASIKRGTNEVTVGEPEIMGAALVSALNGGDPNAYINGGTANTETETTLRLTLFDYITPQVFMAGDLTIVFYDRVSGALLDQAVISVVSIEDAFQITHSVDGQGSVDIYMRRQNQPDYNWYVHNNVPEGEDPTPDYIPPLGPQVSPPDPRSCAAIRSLNPAKPWRLPTLEELYVIRDYVQNNEGVNYYNLDNGANSFYWSSTNSANSAYGYQMTTTGSMSGSKWYLSYYGFPFAARCIRDK